MNWVVRAAAVFFALSWLVVPGYGAIDLSVSWDPEWKPVLSGGWGIFCTVLVAAPFLTVAVRPRAAAPAVWTLVLASGCLLGSALLSREPQLLGLLIWLWVGIAAVAASHVRAWWPVELRPDVPAVLVLAVPAVLWLGYAWDMAARNRQDRPETDFTSGVDHYSVMAALGLALALLPLLAACWPDGRRQVGSYVAVCAGYFGVLCYHWAGYAGGIGQGWSLATIAWAVGLAGWAWAPRRARVVVPG